ncbi:hypothetical protein T459_05518 [Capsicum annuum]|uniref:Myb/SANT-like DNA-binding domain-containing protein n=1 Tax=Capsicum annuum TaxID=4072 RepID=A0A2G3A828_CAPAN|nr:hypothetical protein T459_05518 [Capsicum annuum]
MGEITEFSPQVTAPSRPLPFREDCWSEQATWTLVDAWGRRYMELNRGNLRQKDWQFVSDSVNALHGHTKKSWRTDIQCKNRIDTLKKKYKVEKAKIIESNGTLKSSWPFFERLDLLIGNSDKKVTPVMASPLPLPLSSPPMGELFCGSCCGGEEDCDEEEEEDMEDMEEMDEESREDDGIRRLAKAIERFGEIYERVEGMKQRQMVELEKQRMQFAKDLEVQRMQLFMDTQVQLERIKHTKRSGSDGIKLTPF